MNFKIRKFDDNKNRRKETEVEEVWVCRYENGERLWEWQSRIQTERLDEGKATPPSTGFLTLVICSAFLLVGSVAFMFLKNMGPDPLSSGAAVSRVIAVLGSVIGSGGIIGAAIKFWRDRH